MRQRTILIILFALVAILAAACVGASAGPISAGPPAGDDAGSSGPVDGAESSDVVPPPVPPGPDDTCPPARKLCDRLCVAVNDPSYGCSPIVCGEACPSAANGKPTCKAGACTLACDPGYGVCPAGGPEACIALDTFYKDVDGDGFGGATTAKACSAPPGYVGVPGDCHDTNSLVKPGQTQEFAVPYIVFGGTLESYDYDCDGFERTTSPVPACTKFACYSDTVGKVCIKDGPITSRAPSANPPNPTCGQEAKLCKYDGLAEHPLVRRSCH